MGGQPHESIYYTRFSAIERDGLIWEGVGQVFNLSKEVCFGQVGNLSYAAIAR